MNCWNICLEILHILPHFFHILKKSTYKTSFSPKPFLGHKISHKFLPSTSSFSLWFPSLSVSHFPSAAFTPSDSSFLFQFPPSCLLLTPFSFYSTILLILFFINNTHTHSLSLSVSMENRGLCVRVDRRGVRRVWDKLQAFLRSASLWKSRRFP